MGRTGLQALLETAGLLADAVYPPDNMSRQFDFALIAAMNAALEEMYGARGGRGMALKIGRASFACGMKRFGALAGVADPAFQVLPLLDRVDLGLKALASIFTNFSDQKTALEDAGEHYLLHIDASPFAWGRVTDKPVCHALVGIVQECLRYVSNGYEFHVYEVACTATGTETCILQVNKQPLGAKRA